MPPPETATLQELLSGLASKTDEARTRWVQFFNEKTHTPTETPVQTGIAFDASRNAFKITIFPYSDSALLDHADTLMTAMKTLAPDEKFFIKIMLEKNNIHDTLDRIAFTHREHIEEMYLCEFDNTELSYLLSDFQQVNDLWLIGCSVTGDAPFWTEIKALQHLQGLHVHKSHALTTAPNLKDMERLEHLAFHDCPFQRPPELEGCTSLKSLTFEHCPLEEAPDIGKPANLKTLTVTHSRLTHAPDIKNLSALEVVNLSWNFMTSPPDTEGLSSLRTLNLSETFIEYLPDLLQCPNLSSLNIDQCQRIKPPPQIALIQRIYQENPQLFTRIFPSFSNLGQPWCIDFSGFTPEPEKFMPLTQGLAQSAYNKALQMAILYNLPTLAEQALNFGADIESSFVSGSTPLLEACLFLRPEIAGMLLERGANVKCIKHNTSATPLIIARAGGSAMAACAEKILTKDRGFSEEITWIKKLAHEFAIAGRSHLNGCEIPREGFSHQFFMQHFPVKGTPFYRALAEEISRGDGPILKCFSDRVTSILEPVLQSATKRLALIEALHQCANAMENPVDMSVQEEALLSALQERLATGRPAVCFNLTKTDVGWSWHIWGLVIFKQPDADQYHVYRCNRGYGSFGMSGVLGGLFSHAEMLQMVKAYREHTDWKFASFKEGAGFFNTVHQKLSTAMPRTHLSQKQQDLGNCSYYSLQAVELAVLKLVLMALLPDAKSVTALARDIKRVKSEHVRRSDLQEYLNLHGPNGTSSYPPDLELLTDISQKAAAKQKLAPYQEAVEAFMTAVKPQG